MKKEILIYLFVLCIANNVKAQHNWTRTNPGGGGAIACVKASPVGIIYAASDLSGIYKSSNNGQSWEVLGANQGLKETHISALGFDPSNSEIFFAGTYIGLYKTEDGGNLFDLVFPKPIDNFDYSYIEDVAIAASNPNIGYLTHHPAPESFGDIYKTVDGGNNWNAVVGENLPDNLHLIKIMIHPTDENIVYVLTGKSRWGCSEANLYKSIDGGVNWIEIGAAQGDILDFDLHPTNTNIVFISTFLSSYTDSASCKELSFGDYLDGDQFSGEFYKSIDQGVNFTQISDKTGIISVGINDPNKIRLLDVLYPFDWNGNAGTWETADGGSTWSHTGFVNNWQKGYSENQYFAFAYSFNGLNKTVTKDIFNSDKFYGAFGQWAWGSFDGGVTLNNISTEQVSENHWISTGVENINGHCIDVNQINPNVVYIGGYDIGFWYSTDHGNSWTRTQPDYNTYPNYSWDLGVAGTVPTNIAKRGAGSNVMTLLNDPDRENVVWASFSRGQFTDINENAIAKTGLFKSTNYGEDWILVTNGLPNYDNSIRMYGLALDRASNVNNRTLFITIDGVVYRSVDDGDSWQVVLSNKKLKFIEVDKLNSNIIYAGGSDGLWKSVDSGDNWSEIGTVEMHKINTDIRPDIVPTWINWTGGTPTYPWEGVFDIETDPNNAGTVYVTVLGENKGLYKTENGGNAWSHIITDSTMRGVSVAPENSNIVYATSSKSYHSGGFGNSKGILYSTDAGQNWIEVNDNMAYNYGGILEVETGSNPSVWVWSPGTGVQQSKVPYFEALSIEDNLLESTIYPNPTTAIINISDDYLGSEYQIISISGQLLMKGTINEHTLNVEKLKTGIYLLKLNKGTKKEIFKIIKR